MENNFKAVLFDMDGVLLDTESVCKICWNRAAAEYGVDDIEKAYYECVGTNTNDTLQILKKYCAGKVSVEEFHNRTGELFYVVEREQGLKKMPYVVECLESLKSRGLRLAVASSTRWENVSRQLKAAGIFDFFETITTGDTVEHSKPAPDIYIKSFESLSLLPNDCVAVEDSPNGVRAAVAAGLKCVMVPDQIQPDDEMKKIAWKIIASLKALPETI
ncbi:HAD family hydrolase [Treponema zioleckii]|uniref:HAD family hydrolase n=1 Tax=Treponema zioleckii TaxID=331680 RepID=UPI00168A472F|nr:HAD family phosphatase [Treponema zioleckii]